MKNLLKNLTIFIVLSIAISGLISCSNSGVSEVDKTLTVEGTNEKTSGETAKKDEFPPAPEGIVKADLKALEGENFKIEDFKGDVVLINLWATWCGPCIKEMPELIAMQEKYGDKGFKVIGLNTDDESAEAVKVFVEKQKLNYKIGWATQEVMKEFFKISELPGIPQSIIVNRNGNMTGVFRGGGPEVVQKMVETVDQTMAE